MKSKGKTDSDGWVWRNDSYQLRNLMSNIYWLQREMDSKVMSLHQPGCDSIRYYHHGCGLKYFIVDPKLNTLMVTTLGPNFENGHGFQLIIPKHCWVAAMIEVDEDTKDDKEQFVLTSESCCPGFDWRDWRMITWKEIMDTNLSEGDKKLLKQFVNKNVDVDVDEYY